MWRPKSSYLLHAPCRPSTSYVLTMTKDRPWYAVNTIIWQMLIGKIDKHKEEPKTVAHTHEIQSVKSKFDYANKFAWYFRQPANRLKEQYASNWNSVSIIVPLTCHAIRRIDDDKVIHADSMDEIESPIVRYRFVQNHQSVSVVGVMQFDPRCLCKTIYCFSFRDSYTGTTLRIVFVMADKKSTWQSFSDDFASLHAFYFASICCCLSLFRIIRNTVTYVKVNDAANSTEWLFTNCKKNKIDNNKKEMQCVCARTSG